MPEKTEKKNKGGRPKKTLTTEQMAQVEALASVLSQEQIADYLGIARNTFIAIVERDTSVFERYKRGKAKAIGAVAQGLLKQAREGNTSAAMFYLKTQAGWREKSDGADSESSPSPITIQFIATDGRVADRNDTPSV